MRSEDVFDVVFDVCIVRRGVVVEPFTGTVETT